MSQRAVVIGAGITGTLVAHSLAARGWAVTLLEGEHVGAGSSSRTAAGIRQQFSTPETVLGMRYAVDYYRRFRELVGGDESPIVQNGYLFLLGDGDEVAAARRRVRMQTGLGLDVTLLGHDELATQFPWVDRHAVLGATWCPSDGFLHPASVYNEAAAAGVRLGVALVQRAPVVSAVNRAGVLTSVTTPKGTFEADVFVDATNAWSPRLAAILGAVALPVTPFKRYLWFAERAGSLREAELLAMPLVIAPSGAYCRPENGGSLLMGWAHDAPAEPAFGYDDQDRIEPRFFHKTGTDSMAYETWASLAEVIPQLGEFSGITATTSGYYATTPDHNPYLGFDPETKNLIRAVGFSGHGAMFGPFTALVVATLAEAGRPVPAVRALGHDIPIAAFALDREPSHAETQVI